MPDGRTWRCFAEEHQDSIRWSKPQDIANAADEWEYL
jgi:hypothetical protein